MSQKPTQHDGSILLANSHPHLSLLEKWAGNRFDQCHLVPRLIFELVPYRKVGVCHFILYLARPELEIVQVLHAL
jgi:hypothetical protein